MAGPWHLARGMATSILEAETAGRQGRHAETAQDLSILLGKILRIDVESGVRPYSIPPSNPFTGNDNIRDEIWASGLRNPWGFAFDQETGALFIPDAGHSSREEVNYQPAASAGGENYGWYAMEANRCFQSTSLPCRAEEFTMPVAVYSRPMGCVVVGGAVNRGARAPHLRGVFVYADFCIGRVWGLQRPNPDVEGAWQNRLLFDVSVPVSSIGEDEEGNLYLIRVSGWDHLHDNGAVGSRGTVPTCCGGNRPVWQFGIAGVTEFCQSNRGKHNGKEWDCIGSRNHCAAGSGGLLVTTPESGQATVTAPSEPCRALRH